MATKTYTCADCGGTFDTDQPDEVAQQEALEVFGKRGDAPGMAIVCDDCYREIMSVITEERRQVRTLPVLTFAISQSDVDLLNVEVSALEQAIARRLLEELERQTWQMLMTGLPSDKDGRPLVGISPIQTARGFITYDGN